MIGDKESDIKAGKSAGCKTILVKIGYTGNGGKIDFDVAPDYFMNDLEDVANIIKNKSATN